MNTNDWLVILGGLAIGYLVVWMMWGRARPPQRPAAVPGGEPWHVTLGVAADAPLEDVRRAYLALVGQYDPDKVATLGSDLQQLAEQKRRLITAAYDAALAERGIA